MNSGESCEHGQASQAAADAALSAALFAVDPVGLGGVVLRAAAGPAPRPAAVSVASRRRASFSALLAAVIAARWRRPSTAPRPEKLAFAFS